MKKTFITFLALTVTLGVMAQTQFRKLTFDEALAAGKAEGKPIFIDFHTSWCGPCKMMNKQVFPQKVVGDFLNNAFVCVQLDAEKEAPEQAKRYKIDAYPTMIVVDGDGNEIYRKVGANLNPESFVSEVKSGTDPELTPDKVKAKYEAGERTAEVVSTYAEQLIQQYREMRRNPDESIREKAVKIVNDYYATLSDAQKLEEKNFFVFSYSYCSNPADVKAKWLVENKGKFAAERQDKVKETLENLCLYRTGTLLQCIEEYTADDIDLLASTMKVAECNTKGEHDPALRILKARLDGDEAYLAQLKKDFTKLVIEEQSSVAVTFDSGIKSNDKEVLDKANKFIRSQLPIMDATNIYYAAMAIMKLEKRMNPEAGGH